MTQDPNAKAAVLEKLKKLFRVTEARGATQQEAETAMQKAQALMTEFGLHAAQITDDEGRRSVKIDEEQFKTARRRYDFDNYIARAVKKCFEVDIFWTQYFDTVSHKFRHAYTLVGDEIDREFVKLVIQSMSSLMVKGLNAYLKSIGRAWNAADARGFYSGVADGYIAASKRGNDDAKKSAAPLALQSYALVLVNKKDAIAKYVTTQMTIRKAKRRSVTVGDSSAYVEGRRQGEKLDVGMKKID
jgi:hypothetical protein